MPAAGLSRQRLNGLDDQAVYFIMADSALGQAWRACTSLIDKRPNHLPAVSRDIPTYIGRLNMVSGRPAVSRDIVRDFNEGSEAVPLQPGDQIFAFGLRVAFQVSKAMIMFPRSFDRDAHGNVIRLAELCTRNEPVTFVLTPHSARPVLSWGQPLGLAVSI